MARGLEKLQRISVIDFDMKRMRDYNLQSASGSTSLPLIAEAIKFGKKSFSAPTTSFGDKNFLISFRFL